MSPERTSDEIRRDIERTRADMDETVDQLEGRLSPGQLFDQAWGAVKDGGGVGDVVRDHPVPLALMGLGVAWLAIERATGNGDSVGTGTHGRAEGRVGPYRGDAVSGDDESVIDRAKHMVSDAASTVKDKVSDAADSVKQKAAGAGESASGGAPDSGELTDRIASRAGDVKDEVQHRARQAQRGALSFLEDQPLAAAAVTFGIGLAAGLAAPTTRWEDELMGSTADTLKDGAERATKDAGRAAKHAASEAADAAREEASRQDLGDDVRRGAERVAESAKRAATDTARREGLTGDDMKDRVGRIAAKTKDEAKRDMR